MTQGDLLYSVEKNPGPSTQLPECAEEMYTHIDNLAWFRVALAAAERLVNIYRHNREEVKLQPLKTTAHRFEVRKKDVYELLWGKKYTKVKTKTNEETPTESEAPPAKKAKVETIAKSAHQVVTMLVAPLSAAISPQQAAASSSKNQLPPHKLSVLSGPPHPPKGMYLEKLMGKNTSPNK